ncbi:cubilin-like protein, partial [Leptotrombidium deliense]
MFEVSSDEMREGTFMSPTYPGVYPKNLQCVYTFLGRKGQRLKIKFNDYDLFYGNEHCPFDYIKVYDGSSINDPLTNRYCAQYEFSERFVNLGFIGKRDGENIRGTECDQKILSHKESNGSLYSANYPFLYHSNTICTYYIYGLQDEQNLEKVLFDFEKIEIPVPKSDINDCMNASLKIYLTSESMDEPDYIFCGSDVSIPQVVSEGPIIVMLFSSGSSQGSGFKAHYSFETDYRVPGTPDPPGCRFKYDP